MDRLAKQRLIEQTIIKCFEIFRAYPYYDKQLDDILQEYFLHCYDSYEMPNADELEKVVSKWLLEKENER